MGHGFLVGHMRRRKRSRRRSAIALVIALVVASLGIPQTSFAMGSFAALSGFDVSFPECHGGYPGHVSGQGIVGANGGRAFTPNPCLADEIRWASQNGLAPS